MHPSAPIQPIGHHAGVDRAGGVDEAKDPRQVHEADMLGVLFQQQVMETQAAQRLCSDQIGAGVQAATGLQAALKADDD